MGGTDGPDFGPIFIVGTMRSGSTLLRLVLDAHPDLAIGVETGFMRSVDGIITVPGFLFGDRWYERHGLALSDLEARIAAFYDAIFRDHAHALGRARWGEKTPFHVWHLERMARLFPDARFVVIVRHAGGAATSLYEWRHDFTTQLHDWVSENHEILRRAPALGDRLCLLRYEDLLTDPRGVLQELLPFAGLSWSDDVLRHHEVHAARGNVEPVEGGSEPTRPIDPARAWGWREKLDAPARAQVEAIAGETLRWFGYEADGETLAPIGAHALTSAAELTARLVSQPLALAAPTGGARSNDDLTAQLDAAQAELTRLRRQRSVRVARALSMATRSRSTADLRASWRLLTDKPV
ncbi:MAG: sulfotransferase protein [Actinomycetia bacterium]|nr:sulfotransferase protein [Actinomycetes bacterium]